MNDKLKKRNLNREDKKKDKTIQRKHDKKTKQKIRCIKTE